MPLYLGFDSSTQSLTAIVIRVDDNGSRSVIFERSLRFDDDFPNYGTRNGVLNRTDPLVAHSSPQMWADALDVLMGQLASDDSGVDVRDIRAIAGSGQQHGSVYLNAQAEAALASLDAGASLASQVPGMLARSTSPIWMDSSTTAQCQAIAAEVGGEEMLTRLTGSRAFERFTGPQIRKFYEEDPEAYGATAKVHLVSSFLASLLAGKHAPIDTGDGAGMNLMDIEARAWAPRAVEATSPGLAEKLPEVAESWTQVGGLSRYWVDRYGFSPQTRVVAWSGDNPCSLIGVGLVKPGRVAISLGTSDTMFGFMSTPRVDLSGAGHVFGSPTGDYMSLICFKNGSLARERVRQKYDLDWAGFSAKLRETSPGNGGGVLLPWHEPEITPAVHEPGFRRYGIDENDVGANVRGVIEGQMLSTAVHSEWIGMEVTTIYATGGAARNRDILQVMADVHEADVYQFEVGNSACLGAALRAYHADEVARGRDVNWEAIVTGFAEPVHESRIAPRPQAVKCYQSMRQLFRACVDHAVRGGADPAVAMEEFRGSLAS